MIVSDWYPTPEDQVSLALAHHQTSNYASSNGTASAINHRLQVPSTAFSSMYLGRPDAEDHEVGQNTLRTSQITPHKYILGLTTRQYIP